MVDYYQHTITVREVVDAVPDTIFVTIPDDWFEQIPKNKGVYDSFYEYIEERYNMDKKWGPLHQVYVGDLIDDKLREKVREKIKREHKLSGEKLDQAVSWSDFSSGPQRLIHTRMKVIGPDAFILLDTEWDSPQHEAISSLWWRRLKDRNAKIAREAKGNSFYTWLMKNIKREDPVGDIAGDIKEFPEFPSNATSYYESKLWMESIDYCDDGIRSMRDAWVEYTRKYPERLDPIVVCVYCEKKIVDFANAILALSDWYEPLEFYHQRCFANKIYVEQEEYDDDEEYEYEGVYVEIGDKTIQELLSFMADEFSSRYRKGVEEWLPKRLYEKYIKEKQEELLLYGIPEYRGKGKTKIRNGGPSPTVYFIQTDRDDCVKIGYTSSLASRLRAYATHSSVEPRLLFSFPGDKGTERVLHKQFEHLRIEGKREWFRLDDEILSYIEVLRHDH